MPSSSSCSYRSRRYTLEELLDKTHCDCDPPLPVEERVSWSTGNPGRRYKACPIYVSTCLINCYCYKNTLFSFTHVCIHYFVRTKKKCGFYGFIDPELPSAYYKDLLFKMYVGNYRLNGQTSKETGKDDPNNQLAMVEMKEEIVSIKSTITLLTRVVVFLAVILAYRMI